MKILNLFFFFRLIKTENKAILNHVNGRLIYLWGKKGAEKKPNPNLSPEMYEVN